MILYPAIDLMDGKAVRLRKGVRGEKTVYGDPLEFVRQFRDAGAAWLHLVDLDAAFDGSTRCLPLIEKIVETFGGNVELGGGLRTMEDVRQRMDAGVQCAILGSVCVKNPDLVRQACAAYPDRIVAGVDARDGMVAVHGWVEKSDVDAVTLARAMKELGVRRVIYTDVSRDGMMQGPNLDSSLWLFRETGLDIVVSGGISSLQDLKRVKESGLNGAILGRAFYDGAVDIAEALRVCGKEITDDI